MSGIKAGERAAKDLHKVAIAAKAGVHVPEVGVHVVSVPRENIKAADTCIRMGPEIRNFSYSVYTVYIHVYCPNKS